MNENKLPTSKLTFWCKECPTPFLMIFIRLHYEEVQLDYEISFSLSLQHWSFTVSHINVTASMLSGTWWSRGVGCYASLLQRLSVVFWFIAKSYHNDQGLLAIVVVYSNQSVNFACYISTQMSFGFWPTTAYKYHWRRLQEYTMFVFSNPIA